MAEELGTALAVMLIPVGLFKKQADLKVLRGEGEPRRRCKGEQWAFSRNTGNPHLQRLTPVNSDVAIRFGLVGLLAYWSWGIIAPFLTIILWSAILTVALYPLFDRLTRWLGHRWLSAVLITLLCLLIIVAPVTSRLRPH